LWLQYLFVNVAIFGDDPYVDPRTATLIALAKGGGLLRKNLGRKELKSCKQRIEQMINGELTGQAVKEVIQAIKTVIILTNVLTHVVARAAGAAS
jgi:hypothetical protein